jgi:regulator of protease activity HflC (stomatin/prohibitin superfamily)
MKKMFSSVALFMLCLVFMQSCTQVDSTEAGFVIKKSGSYRGIDSLPLVTGFNWYFPFTESIITIPTTQQHIVWSEGSDEGSAPNQQMVVPCLGGAGFKIDVGFNYRVNPYKASKIYLKYRTDNLGQITDTYLRNVVRGSMNEVSSTLTVDSILNNVSAFEHSCKEKIITVLLPEGFNVDNFYFIHAPVPSDPNLAASINAKIKARQDAATAVMQLQISVAEANKEVAKARGDSSVKVINALGEAEAVRKIQQVLTPTYVEYIRANKWDGALPTTTLGSSSTLFSIK